MIKWTFKNAWVVLLSSLISISAFAGSGELFNVTSTGNAGTPINITLCLNINGKSPLSCQYYTTYVGTLSIKTTIQNHTYNNAGIRVDTPGYIYTPQAGLKKSAWLPSTSRSAFTQIGQVSDTHAAQGPLASTSVNVAPVFTSSASTTFTVGDFGTFTVSASGIPAPTFSVTVGTLPTGITLNSTTGVLSGTPTVGGSFSFTLSATNGTPPAAIQPFTLVVNKAIPTITWHNPAAIIYGTPLSGTQLDATASVTGTFVYTPGAGTILNAGNQPLSVNFTPTDTSNYDSAPANVTLVVNKALATANLQSSPNTSQLGDVVTYTATITSNNGQTITGNINFDANGITIAGCAAVQITSGTAICSASLSANVYTITTSTYSNTNDYSLTYDTLSQTVYSPTTTVLSSALNQFVEEQQNTFTAIIVSSSDDPVTDGQVTFTAQLEVGVSSPFTLCDSVSVTSGKATCATTSSMTAPTPPYSYSVLANYTGGSSFNQATSSSFSQYVISTAIATTVPATPIGVAAIPGNGQVTVSWYPPANTGGAEITGYTVHYGETGTHIFTTMGCTTTANTCVISQLNNNSQYTFTVAATNTSPGSTAAYGPVAYSSPVMPLPALSASPSTLALSALGSTGGLSRAITITNNSASALSITNITIPLFLTSKTTTTCLAGGTLAAGATCTFMIKPGTTVSSVTGYTACTNGTLAVSPSEIGISYGNSSVLTVDVVVLGYGCQYQGGYVFSIDDTTPFTGSIGGTVASLTDNSTGAGWSTTYENVWGIDYASTIGAPVPGASNTDPLATLTQGQLNCNGNNDGSCNTNNIITLYTNPSYAPAAYACIGTINGFTDWYLPSICEMGYYTSPYSYGAFDCGVSPGKLQNMQFNLVDNGIGGFTPMTTDTYWSSTIGADQDSLADKAAFQNISPGFQRFADKTYSYAVRCARALTR